MVHGAVLQRSVAGAGEVPLAVRFLGKLVLEVLPAALASVIGAFLFAHYQFDRSAAVAAAAPTAAATPASVEMMQLVRDEHAMVHNFLLAQQAAARKAAIAADAADERADTQAKLAVEASHRIVSVATAKPLAPHGVASTAAPASAAAALPTIMVAAEQRNLAAMPSPPPRRPSLIAQTLAVPGRVAVATLHAVMTIGGIPSWIGHRFGDDLESAAPLSGMSS